MSSKTRGRVRGSFNLKRAKVGNLTATIKVESRIGELYNFKVTPNTYYPGGKGAPKKGLKAKVEKKSNMKRLVLHDDKPGDTIDYAKRVNVGALVNAA